MSFSRDALCTSSVISALLVGLILAAHSPGARACDPGPPSGPVFPPPGATDVPLDTLVFGGSALSVASTGQALPADPVSIPDLPYVKALRPRAPLPANEEIIVSGGWRFRTGTAASRDGGQWRLVSSRQRTLPGDCGDSCGDDLQTSLELETAAADRPATLFLATRAAREPRTGRIHSTFFVVPAGSGPGRRMVQVSSTIGFGEEIRISPLTSAGMPDPTLELPVSFEDDEGGCRLGAGRGGTSLRTSVLPLVLLGAFAALLRRRRSEILDGAGHGRGERARDLDE